MKKVLHHIRATSIVHTVKVNRAMKHSDKTNRQARPYGAVQSRVVVTLATGEQTTVADELQAAQVKMMKLSLDGQAKVADTDVNPSNPSMEAELSHKHSQGLINPVLDDSQHASTPIYPHPTPRVTKFSPLWRN